VLPGFKSGHAGVVPSKQFAKMIVDRAGNATTVACGKRNAAGQEFGCSVG
jgi:hypothetical protein